MQVRPIALGGDAFDRLCKDYCGGLFLCEDVGGERLKSHGGIVMSISIIEQRMRSNGGVSISCRIQTQASVPDCSIAVARRCVSSTGIAKEGIFSTGTYRCISCEVAKVAVVLSQRTG